jgi:dolichyl-phosphate beta-glucosyltransferase
LKEIIGAANQPIFIITIWNHYKKENYQVMESELKKCHDGDIILLNGLPLLPFVSVVLPSFNERLMVEATLAQLSSYLNSLNVSYEIIVSDDGSTDQTSSLPWQNFASLYQARLVLNRSNEGKGHALRKGILSSRGNFVFFTDIDLPVNLESIKKALELLRNKKTDMVIGDRRLSSSQVRGSGTSIRKIGSLLFNVVVQLLLLPGYKDTQCCLKGFSSGAARNIMEYSTVNTYAIDVEIIYIAKKLGLRIYKIPVQWRDVRAELSYHKAMKIIIFELFQLFRILFVIKIKRKTCNKPKAYL